MILIAYDGSDDARFAIDRAGELFTGSDAAVVSVWERFTMCSPGARARWW